MKGKVWIYRFLLIVGAGLVAGFAVQLGADVYQYGVYSLSLHYVVIIRAIEFLIPAVFLITVGFILRKKVKRGEV